MGICGWDKDEELPRPDSFRVCAEHFRDGAPQGHGNGRRLVPDWKSFLIPMKEVEAQWEKTMSLAKNGVTAATRSATTSS